MDSNLNNRPPNLQQMINAKRDQFRDDHNKKERSQHFDLKRESFSGDANHLNDEKNNFGQI